MKRIKLSHKAGSKLPPNTINVARPGKFGNPFNWRNYTHLKSDRDKKCAAKNAFEVWLTKNIYNNGSFVPREIVERREWILSHLHLIAQADYVACWCGPNDCCHGDVLIKLAGRRVMTDD